MHTNTRSTDETADGDAEYVVLGGGHVGAAIARRLHAAGRAVLLIDEAYEPGPVPGVRGDPRSLATLRAAGIPDGATVIAATGRDRRNLLVAQLVSTHFDVARVRALVNTPDRRDLFEDVGHEAICATDALSDAVTDGLT
jgi:trk system potassium uptake protein TrkA